MSIARHHADWLSLIEVSGPFLSMPVLLRAFPAGLDAHEPEVASLVRTAHGEWAADRAGGDGGLHQAWIDFVYREVLDLGDDLVVRGQAVPPGLVADVREHGEILRPDAALVVPAGHEGAGKPLMLMQHWPDRQDLDAPAVGSRWQASPAARMTELLRRTDVPIGLVTNGERWMLVYAPRNEATGYVSWYAEYWLDEPVTLRAFRTLFSRRRWFGVAPEDRLQAMIRESQANQQAVTAVLGLQVRRAVEVLIRTLDRLNAESDRKLLADISDQEVYQAALTVMMRLVFLFCAEERKLLLLGHPLYDQHYAVSTLSAQLREVADQQGEEILERRCDAWSRLLATFRAVYGGIQHEDLRLPAYGGTLFDPDRFPFLEGRKRGSDWRLEPAAPLAIDNRTVLHLLEALQVLRERLQGGGPLEARRLSFRSLDVEQIGHVYEGLLDHTARQVDEAYVGLEGTKAKEPEVPLAALEAAYAQGLPALVKYLKEATGRSESALKKAVEKPGEIDEAKLRVACGNDPVLLARVRPFAGLVRVDTVGIPLVTTSGGILVTQGSERRATGTHYTPRSLTEDIVRHALDPQVYEGMADGVEPAPATLKAADAILALKVCDFTCGSGAFLVQACRYLAEKVVEAWARDAVEAFPEPDPTAGAQGRLREVLLPRDASERLVFAQRLVADRCLYGVDINPMAVEMAKLSLWLVTMQRNRPFTFLDHSIRCGDSLLGIYDMNQIETWSLDQQGKTLPIMAAIGRDEVAEMRRLRRLIEDQPEDDFKAIRHKAHLLGEVKRLAAKFELAADLIVGQAFAAFDKQRSRETGDYQAWWIAFQAGNADSELKEAAAELLGYRRSFHWPLEFPEVFEGERGGFDALVGNPPFMGGQRITGELSTVYRDYLVTFVAGSQRGSADLCAYLFLRAAQLLAPGGSLGLLATNTLAQGDTREVGLEQLVARGVTLFRAVPSRKWPGEATLEVAHVWARQGEWRAAILLDDQRVPGISSYLASPEDVAGKPHRLRENAGKVFQGSNVLGMGFVMSSEEAAALSAKNECNQEVLSPYLVGEDINSRADQSPSRWVVNFRDWSLDRCRQDYPICLELVERLVKPERDRLATGDATARDRARRWWQFARPTVALYEAIASLPRVMALSLVSSHLSVSVQCPDMVFSHRCAVLPLPGWDHFAVIQSTIHELWARQYSSTLETRLNYSPSDCLETFALPALPADAVTLAGEVYYAHRSSICLDRNEGFTKVYNRFHRPDDISPDIQRLRDLRIAMDQAVAAAYGWSDLDLGHGFYETKIGIRFTVSEEARRQVLRRLLALNHDRYAAEVAAGLHDKPVKAKGGRKPAQNKKGAPAGTVELFGRVPSAAIAAESPGHYHTTDHV